VGSVNTASRGEGGVPRSRRPLAAAPAHRRAPEETWLGANEDKHTKLRRNRLQRRAGARGLELRHSAYGYALIDSARKRIEERSDMTLDEIESWLERA
jgi:hypothetical protein